MFFLGPIFKRTDPFPEVGVRTPKINILEKNYFNKNREVDFGENF